MCESDMCECVKLLMNPKQILVIGDVMVDHYTYGKVKRISPEAPVPILHVERHEYLPGGAGNVMHNLKAIGMKVFALGRVGNDAAGKICRNSFTDLGIETRGLVVDSSFVTPLKNRMIADTQQLMRVDYEEKKMMSEGMEEEVLGHFDELLPQIDAIAISDYDKGFCTPSLLQKVIERAKAAGVPVVADPKGVQFSRYKGATLLKPNLSEAIRAANLPEEAGLDGIARALLQETLCTYLMITRSEAGISLFEEKGRQDFPALVHAVKDVTGAGDTVCAVITAALANKIPLAKATMLANRAAGYVVQRVGCVPVDLSAI